MLQKPTSLVTQASQEHGLTKEEVIPLGHLIWEAERAIQDLCEQLSVLQTAHEDMERDGCC
jgi:hypothetical protein